MKAIILAAGLGSRMKPITNDINKSLIEINGEPLIKRMIDMLLKNNILDISIVLGHKSNEVQKYLEKTFSEKFNYIYNFEYKTTNNIHSLKLAFQNQKDIDNTILLECDLFFNEIVLLKCLNSKHLNVAMIGEYDIGMDGTVVDLDSNNKIIDIIQSNRQTKDFDFSNKFKTLNIYKFSKNFLISFTKIIDFYSDTFDNNCYYESILSLITFMKLDNIYGESVNNYDWMEIDTMNDLEKAKYLFEPKSRLDISKRNFGGKWNFKYLDFNLVCNSEFPTENFLSDIKNNISELIVSYGTRQSILDQKVSRLIDKDSKNVRFLNGVSQIYPILKEYLKYDDTAIPEKTFGEYYKITKLPECPEDIYNISNFNPKLPSLEEITSYCNCACIINPNNPTGEILSNERILDLIEKNPGVLFIIDESFIDFSNQKSILDNIKTTNVIYLKSLGKCWGIPGVRMGFVYTLNRDFLNLVDERIPIWNANSIAEYILEIIPRYQIEIQNSYQKIKENKRIFINDLKDLDLKIFESHANFIMIEINNAYELQKYLLENYNILIKVIDDKLIRLTINHEDNNKCLIDKIKRWKNFKKN